MHTCIYPNCTAIGSNDLSHYCVVHIRFFQTSLYPKICSLPFCNSKCKTHGTGSLCRKHRGNITLCVHPFCTAIATDNFHLCHAHTTVPTCRVSECITPVSTWDDYCGKHLITPSLCCFEKCTALCINPSSFCIYHHKLGRFCSTDDCFRLIENQQRTLCPAHAKNANRCVIPLCRLEMFEKNICKKHYVSLYNYPVEKDIEYEQLMREPILFDHFDIDLSMFIGVDDFMSDNIQFAMFL